VKDPIELKERIKQNLRVQLKGRMKSILTEPTPAQEGRELLKNLAIKQREQRKKVATYRKQRTVRVKAKAEAAKLAKPASKPGAAPAKPAAAPAKPPASPPKGKGK